MLMPTYPKIVQKKLIKKINNDRSDASTSILNSNFQINEEFKIDSDSSGDLPIDITDSTNINHNNSDLNINLKGLNTKYNHDCNDLMILNNKLSFENKTKQLTINDKNKKVQKSEFLYRSYKYWMGRDCDYISSNKNELSLPCPVE